MDTQAQLAVSADANTESTKALSARVQGATDIRLPAPEPSAFKSLYTTLATFRGSGLPLPKGVTPQLYQELGGKVGAQGGC